MLVGRCSWELSDRKLHRKIKKSQTPTVAKRNTTVPLCDTPLERQARVNFGPPTLTGNFPQRFNPSTNHQVEGSSLCECSEVPVSRDERDPGVDTALSNQRVSEPCFSFLRQHSDRLPVAPGRGDPGGRAV